MFILLKISVFNDYCVSNSRNSLSFVVADLGEHGSCWHKEDSFPCAPDNLRKNVGCKHGSCTAAAASAGMGVLRGVVIDQKSAVLMDFAYINMLFKKKILKDPLAYHPQISGKNSVVILRGAAEIIKILPYGIAGSRSHAAAHIKRIMETIVDYLPCGDPCNDGAAGTAAKRRVF